MDNLIEFIQDKANESLNDYNRFMEKPNEYKNEALLSRGKYQAYQDLLYYLKTHKEGK